MSQEYCVRIITVYSDLCLGYRVKELLLCTVMLSGIRIDGNATVYIDVCLNYSVVKYYCVQ